MKLKKETELQNPAKWRKVISGHSAPFCCAKCDFIGNSKFQVGAIEDNERGDLQLCVECAERLLIKDD